MMRVGFEHTPFGLRNHLGCYQGEESLTQGIRPTHPSRLELAGFVARGICQQTVGWWVLCVRCVGLHDSAEAHSRLGKRRGPLQFGVEDRFFLQHGICYRGSAFSTALGGITGHHSRVAPSKHNTLVQNTNDAPSRPTHGIRVLSCTPCHCFTMSPRALLTRRCCLSMLRPRNRSALMSIAYMDPHPPETSWTTS